MNGSKFLAVKSEMSDHSPDACVITEAELPVGDKPHVPGYTTFLSRVDKCSVVRTVIFMKDSLHSQQLDTPSDIPVVAVKVGKAVLIGVYRQFALPSATGTTRGEPFENLQYEALEELVRNMCDRFQTVYMTGDFNLDLDPNRESAYYRQGMLSRWLALLEELGISWSPTGHTYVSDGKYDGQHRKRTLDHFYSRTTSSVKVQVLPSALSDHHPILAQIGREPPRKPERQTRCERNWKGLNKQLLELALYDWDWGDLLATTDPNEALALLNKALSIAIDIAVPEKKFTTPNYNVRLKSDTRQCMKARDLAKSQGALHYKSLRNRCLSMVRRDHIAHNLERVRRSGPSGAWQVVNELTGKCKGSELPLPGGLKSDVEAANAANEYYVQKVLTLRKELKTHCATTSKEAVSPDHGFKFHCVGTNTLKRALHELQNKSSVGFDKVPIVVFKTGWQPLALPLVHLVNTVIKSGVWPQQWKEILIHPVLKPNKPPLDIASYRPVALLCAISKLTERVLFNQLVDFVESKRILPLEQHGFRKNHSTNTALAAMMTRVGRALDHGLKVGLSCFDFSSAFDTVESAVLDSKMTWASSSARKLIRDYLYGGQQVVLWNGSASSKRTIQYGVRQGSILGPLLYIVLTGDLPKKMTTNIDPAAQATASCYADDSTGVTYAKTWSSTETAMDEIARNLAEYSASNGLYLNVGKTQTMRLNHKETPTNCTLDVLGVKINKNGGFSTHHTNMMASLRGRLGAIRRLATAIGRGKLLREVALSLVVGKVQCNAFITREVRVEAQPMHGDDVATQRLLNDLYRTLIGVKRADHIRVAELADRAKCPTLNQLIAKQAAVSAWRSQNGGPLADLLEPYDDRTRGAAQEKRKPASARCIAANNLSLVWNASKELREAATLEKARQAAHKFAESVRHF